MPYFRLTYEGYTEDEFENQEEALEHFKDRVKDDIDDEYNISIEEWDGSEWV